MSERKIKTQIKDRRGGSRDIPRTAEKNKKAKHTHLACVSRGQDNHSAMYPSLFRHAFQILVGPYITIRCRQDILLLRVVLVV